MPGLSLRLLSLALALCAAGPAAAQWVAVGRWTQGDGFRFVAPGTWMVLTQGGTTTITAEGDNHVGRLELWCRADAPRGWLRFSGYHGEDLRRSPGPLPWHAPEAVTLVIDGRAHERQFDYRPEDREWTAGSVLDAGLLDAFSGGSALELRNGAGAVITRFALNGSGAAREALRRGCGI